MVGKVTYLNYQGLQEGKLLNDLTELYCQLWEYDPNFGEYLKCPICNKYYSHEWYLLNKTVIKSPCCNSELIPAWPRSTTRQMILQQSMDSTFVGFILIDDNLVQGFSWGMVFWNYEMDNRFGQGTYSQIFSANKDALGCFYLKELGVSRLVQGNGYGKGLVKAVFSETKRLYPSYTSALTTHPLSKSVGIYTKIGFRYIGDIPKVPDRVAYGIPKVSEIQLDGM